jgi:hypothetical protein
VKLPGPSPRWRLLAAFALAGAGAAVQLAASSRPETVERVFSRGAYPRIGGALSCLSDPLPFSVAEAGLAALAVWIAYRLGVGLRRVRREKRLRWPDLTAALANALIAAAVAYVAFLALWGLHYQRLPFARTAGLDTRPSSASELEALCLDLVREANDLRGIVEEDGSGVMRVAGGARGALARAPAGFARAAALQPLLAGACGRPKPVAVSPLLSWLGITGIYSPFTGEPNVNVDVPHPDLPFSASHEIAHARGFAREDEASYLGYLACRLHPDPDFRYSGVLAAGLYAQGSLARADRAAHDRVETLRSAAVRRDLEALAAWSARHRGPVQAAARRVNDAYLRSQGQAEGVRSYGRMVDLLLAERRRRR